MTGRQGWEVGNERALEERGSSRLAPWRAAKNKKEGENDRGALQTNRYDSSRHFPRTIQTGFVGSRITHYLFSVWTNPAKLHPAQK
eukprot:scaffold38424_cov168-Amphora_coffeaeformis.AAC.2